MVGCALIAANSAFAVSILRGLQDANHWVEHTQNVLIALYDVRGAARDAEAAQHGFTLTGDPQFRDLYLQRVQATEDALGQLRALITDNPGQQAHYQALVAAIRQDQEIMQAAISGRERGPTPVTAEQLRPVLETAQRVRAEVAAMQAEECRLFAERRSLADKLAASAELPTILGTVGGLALIVLVYRLMATESAARARHVRDRTLELSHAISALRQRGSELRSREEQLSILIEATPAAIAMFDRDLRFIAVSGRFRLDYRLGAQRLIGRHYYDVFPEIPDQWRAVHQRCLHGATERAEEEPFRRSDGSIDWVRWEVRPWYDAAGVIGGMVLFSEVITSRKQAEQALAESAAQLRQAQKMELVGQLTGGIAHDFNNMLGIIIGNVEFLEDAVRGSPAQQELAREILDVALSGAAMTKRLLAFARKQTLKPETIDLREYLPGLQSLFTRTLGETVRVSFEIAEDLWLTRADPAQVGEALLNLAINARDAMPSGGRLAVAASNASLLDPEQATAAGAAPGEYVLLSVTDTGQGMPADVVERAMEPFFTTKEVGKGTGLGLSMVYGFTKQSGGQMKICSQVGLGTTIRLYLPRVATEDRTRERAVKPPPRLPGGSASVLVVDDNVQMAEVARRHLSALGYGVTVVHSAAAAISIVESGVPVDLLFTDVVMPDGLSGHELAKITSRTHPGLKVLLASGYAGVPDHGETQIQFPVLQKPYRRPELAAKVRSVLDQGR
jgi:PAS domain S-box-containing protein